MFTSIFSRFRRSIDLPTPIPEPITSPGTNPGVIAATGITPIVPLDQPQQPVIAAANSHGAQANMVEQYRIAGERLDEVVRVLEETAAALSRPIEARTAVRTRQSQDSTARELNREAGRQNQRRRTTATTTGGGGDDHGESDRRAGSRRINEASEEEIEYARRVAMAYSSETPSANLGRTATAQGKGNCFLIYCGAQHDDALPAGFVNPDAGEAGCGLLLCTRSTETGRGTIFIDPSDGGRPCEVDGAVESDLPPSASRVIDADHGDVRYLAVQGQCYKCLWNSIGCRNCGNVVGLRLVDDCGCESRDGTPPFTYLYHPSRTTLRHRLIDRVPSPTVSSEAIVDQTEKRMEWDSVPKALVEIEGVVQINPVEQEVHGQEDDSEWLRKARIRYRKIAKLPSANRAVRGDRPGDVHMPPVFVAADDVPDSAHFWSLLRVGREGLRAYRGDSDPEV